VELAFVPLEAWTSPSGRTYTLFWRLRGPELDLRLRPLFKEGEILSRTTRVAYYGGVCGRALPPLALRVLN
jgi:predicted secreted hydrolase